MDIFLSVVFLFLFGIAVSGSFLIIKDKQKAWNERNRLK
jgi:hypothetical protein